MRFGIAFSVFGLILLASSVDAADLGPYDVELNTNVAKLSDVDPAIRMEGAEKLGFMRAYDAEGEITSLLQDDDARVRRQAAMSLGWCGGRDSIRPLLGAMNDSDWTVRQAACVSLTNLTGMEFPFDAMALEGERSEQIAKWNAWCENALKAAPPEDVMALLAKASLPGSAVGVTASATYKGPPECLLDGDLKGAYWQTKFVEPPQSVTFDLGQAKSVARVIVHQYSDAFVMTEYSLELSRDGETFTEVKREKGKTPALLKIDIKPQEARFVRITSYGSVNPTYPTTFFEVQILSPEELEKAVAHSSESVAWRLERGVRALGAFGGEGAPEAIIAALGDVPTANTEYQPFVRAGIRSLGRLGGDAAFEYLVMLLDNPMHARYAADALGDLGDPRAVPHLLTAYQRYAKTLNGANPPDVPRGDRMGFPSIDRMLETPYWIIYSLCRLPINDAEEQAALRELAPLIMANLPGDHDTFFLYESEVAHRLTSHLMGKTGRLDEAREHAMRVFGLPSAITWDELQLIESGQSAHPLSSQDETLLKAGIFEADAQWSNYAPERLCAWLPVVCTSSEDIPRLALLLDHPEGWVRLNAAKALAWIGDKRAVSPLLSRLQNAKAEADYGYNPTFKNEEYDDPAPRWREGLIRALGLLQAHEATDLLVAIMNDEGSVAEVRLSAAQALGDLGNERAIEALKHSAANNDFQVVRHAARDAVREAGIDFDADMYAELAEVSPTRESYDVIDDPEPGTTFDSVIFIRGSNDIPNTKGTVEQADRWRSEYAVTDSGPAYRPGRNLYVLSPPRPDGEVRPLTTFEDGYVAEPELSYDGKHVLFCHRGELDPWWHIWRINVDGTGLEQLTFGPYHAVGPTYLPDGRIVFASTRSGIRDEYHGYPCTVLCVMNADGTGMQAIATNIGRDNEPTVLADGRIAFSRLEVFYSRNKTELTLHAVHPDGAMDSVLYGPERRQYWRALEHGPRSPADGQEAPLTHRVLRVTQPQATPDGRNIVLSTQAGLTMVATALRDREQALMLDFQERSYTTPYPLPDGRILCASTAKVPNRADVDLGLYIVNPETQEMELVFNDPETADFEPRPVMARKRPPVRPSRTTEGEYSGEFICTSVFATQETEVAERGRYVRLIEGVPVPARHSTQTNQHEVWKNHGGTLGRVLGTVPLAADGSFYVEAPADRLLHFQVLDSDRRVVGNQKTWIYPRPGEQKACVGCHENPHSTTRGNNPLAVHEAPIDFLPDGREFTYRAKAWFKGHLPGEIEERTRTVRAVNVLGR